MHNLIVLIDKIFHILYLYSVIDNNILCSLIFILSLDGNLLIASILITNLLII